MNVGDVAAKSKSEKEMEVGIEEQVVGLADDTSPPLVRSKRKSLAKRPFTVLDDDVVNPECSTPIGNRKVLRAVKKEKKATKVVSCKRVCVCFYIFNVS